MFEITFVKRDEKFSDSSYLYAIYESLEEAKKAFPQAVEEAKVKGEFVGVALDETLKREKGNVIERSYAYERI